MKKIGLLLWFGLFPFCLHAFPCHITLIKNDCWLPYNVTVEVIDVQKDQPIVSINIPEGERWYRQSFDCQAKQTLLFVGTFSPAFWKQDEGKKYYAKRYWTLPEEIKPNVTAWNMNICYSDDFSAVPLPPDAQSDCACRKEGIPAVEPG